MPGRSFLRTYSRASRGRAIDAPGRVGDQEPEDDEDVAVDERRAGRAGGRVVVDAGPLDVRPVPLRRRVVQGERQPLGPAHQRLDHRQHEVGGDRLGLLPGRRDGRVARPELVAEPGGADPTGDRPPAAGQDGAEEQQGEPGCGPAVEGGRESGEPLARAGVGCEDVMAGSVRGDRLVW